MLRTHLTALILCLSALPAAAQGFSFDLPRLEFPSSAQPSRACPGHHTPGAACQLPKG